MTNTIVTEDLERMLADVGRLDRFDNATVVVTGCAGFIAFYLMHFLVEHAARLRIRKVIGLDTFMLTKPDWLNRLAERFPDVLDLRAFDIARDDIGAIDGAADANLVVHGASIASPTFYRIYPIETVDANIWGLRRLLDFYRGSEALRGFLFFSSSEIYGDADPRHIPTPENYQGLVFCNGPRACYDESKRFGETLCWIYAKQYGMPITVCRPFNNYGPGMRVDDKRLPADFAKCVIGNRDITVLSDGTPTRTFCYISDAVTGYLKCLLHGEYDYFNIGLEKPEIMVRQLAEIYRGQGAKVFGYQGVVRYEKSDDPEYMTDNPNRRCPDIAKARALLGYDPRIFVEEGVGRYLRFLRQERGEA